MEKNIQITKEMNEFFLKDSIERFIRYAKMETTADPNSNTTPSNPKELELGKLLVEELKQIGLQKVEIDEFGYVYAFLRASEGYEKSQALNFIAHMDTSPDASGKNVTPIIHKNYDGGNIKFPKDPDLELSPHPGPPCPPAGTARPPSRPSRRPAGSDRSGRPGTLRSRP